MSETSTAATPAAAPAANPNQAAPAAPAAAPAAAPPPDGGAADPLGRGAAAPAAPDGFEAQPEWLSSLPDDLKGEKSLANFKSIEDLSRGYLETKRLASSKVTLPKDDDPESFMRFAAAVRPEKPDAYQITVPDGDDPAFAEAMRPVFHDAGLLPQQVNMLVEANNRWIQQAKDTLEQKGLDEFEALKAEMGVQEFERNRQAAIGMLNRLGIPAQFDKDMARFVGGGNSLRLFFDLASRMGELGRVDATDVQLGMGQLKGQDAYSEAQRMIKDPAIAEKLLDQNSAERRRYDQLVAAAAQKGA